MLRNLYIKNFVLISELNLEFDNNFNVFTGETGAGKSIFIDALGILVGGRFSSGMIRKDAEKTIIEGFFDTDERIRRSLRDNGFDDDELVITREFFRDGRSISRVNHRTVTASFIKELLSDKIDIHCQRDNQYLLNNRYHLQLLDNYCQNDALEKEVSDKYHVYTDRFKEYEDLKNNDFSDAQIEMISYQLNEITKMKLKVGEDDEIERQLKTIARKEKITNLVDNTREMFTADDGILTRLYEFSRQQSKFEDFGEIKNNVDSIVNAYYRISDDYDSIISYFDNDDISVEDIDALNSRLYDLQRIKRKYNLDIPGLLELKKNLEEQLDKVANREAVLGKLQAEYEKKLSDYLLSAKNLSIVRKDKATALEKAVVEQLKDLNLENARFKVSFREKAPSANGIDNVEFMISMNKGQDLRPLVNVASGGEMSRLMLGLKTVFSELQGTRLIIFDEIDTGVSGYVAFNMGVKMKEISKRCQVFTVTHLASVASLADNHYHIEKTQSDTTTTDVVRLDREKRIRELAVLSSSAVTETSLAAAEELYEKARKVK
ncbi:MAG: DNA repair protein RecN [Erysipelotrichaceae bacterium]|nr:DNA repair protein RecN [Erysipelotrichaceae bacterium]